MQMLDFEQEFFDFFSKENTAYTQCEGGTLPLS
jgi:hypothetical protein